MSVFNLMLFAVANYIISFFYKYIVNKLVDYRCLMELISQWIYKIIIHLL